MSIPWIDSLRLRALDSEPDARVAMASVPLPRGCEHLVKFAGSPGVPGVKSQAVPLAWWPGSDGPGVPRQVLVVGTSEGALGDTLGVESESFSSSQPQPGGLRAESPAWRVGIVEEKKTGIALREVNELVLTHAGREVGISMGIQKPDGPRWWQWVRVEEHWSGSACRAITAAGYVSVLDLDDDDVIDPKKYNSGPWIHRQHWLFVEVYALLFSNGLVRVTARHVNNRIFDQGRDLPPDFVPVVGIRGSKNAPKEPVALTEAQRDFNLGSVQLDVARTADLVSAEHPGKLGAGPRGVAIWQPYEGVEMFLEEKGEPKDEWRLDASEHRMWRGMARSVGFDLTLGDAPIRTRRYLPPHAWIAHCGVMWPDGALPGRGEIEYIADKWVEGKNMPTLSGRFFQETSNVDGEHAHGIMRQAYRTGRRDLYDAAIHHAYASADTGVDHSDFTIRIFGQVRDAISLVLQRNIGMLAAYLETGDPYLLKVATAVADTAYNMDASNWPRRSYGRDAAYIRSLTRLYDITGERFYLRRAATACRRVIACQRPDGSYNDQGGACGAHGHLNEILKPWMNSILSEALVDYLERAPEDGAIEAAVIRTADWLVKSILHDKDGAYWPYEMAWGRNELPPYAKFSPNVPPQKHPSGEVQLEYLARVMLWVSRRTGDARFFQTWAATFERHYNVKKEFKSSYGFVKVAENFPWHEAHLWNVHATEQGVSIAPMLELIMAGREVVVELPAGGKVKLRREGAGVVMEKVEG